MLSSLNLAALQQANQRRRRASTARSPPISRSSSPPGDKEPRDAPKTEPTQEGVAVGKTVAENARDFKGGDENVLDGTDENRPEIGEDRASDAPTIAEDSSAPPAITSSAPRTAENSSCIEGSGLGGGTSPCEGVVDGGGGGADGGNGDGGSSAALLARNGGATFVLVAKEHLVGTWLAVFVRASMLQEVSDIRAGMICPPSLVHAH